MLTALGTIFHQEFFYRKGKAYTYTGIFYSLWRLFSAARNGAYRVVNYSMQLTLFKLSFEITWAIHQSINWALRGNLFIESECSTWVEWVMCWKGKIPFFEATAVPRLHVHKAWYFFMENWRTFNFELNTYHGSTRQIFTLSIAWPIVHCAAPCEWAGSAHVEHILKW